MSVSVEAVSVGEEMAQIFDAGDEPADEDEPEDVLALVAEYFPEGIAPLGGVA